MILELRALKSAVFVVVAALALLFFQWQFVFPVFALGYLGYKYFAYSRLVGKDGGSSGSAGRLLEKTTLLFVVLFLVTRLVVFPLFGDVWDLAALTPGGELNLSDLGILLEQAMGPLSVWAAILVPLAVLSYAVGQFRGRLAAGVDTREAAVRAALWETMARVPIYLFWAGIALLTPIYQFWRGVPEQLVASMGGSLPFPLGISPVLGEVFFAVAAVGQILPVLVVAAYFAVRYDKYDGLTVPEVLGYRGLHPPDRVGAATNVLVPVAAFVFYAAAVVAFVPVGPLLRAAVLLPPFVATVAAADVRALTSRLTSALPRGIPGAGGDAVIFGLCAGLYTFGLFVLASVALGGGLGVDPPALLYYPVFAVPLAFGANTVTALLKASSVSSLSDRVADDPGSLDESEVDRLLAYADARNDRLRASAIDGLASAVRVSAYREAEVVAVFEAALETGDEQFARPGLRGIVSLFRADRGMESVSRLLDAGLFGDVVETMDEADAETRALAAEAFCRMVDAGYDAGRADDLLASLGGVPLAAVGDEVVGEAANQHLTDAAVSAFAHLWYDRNRRIRNLLTADDRRTLLVDLVWWSEYASPEPRATAAYAVTSDPAVTDAAGLDSVREYLDSEVALSRFMAAYVVRSSMDRHADRLTSGELLALLADADPLVRWAGATALREYVAATGESAGVVRALLDHLAECDPATAGSAEATVLTTLELVDEAALTAEEGVAAIVADFVASDTRAVAEPAARLLATFVTANPHSGRDERIHGALEEGLTHGSDAVREQCVRAAAAVIEVAPGDGRPFIRGLVLNLGTSGTLSAIAVSALDEILDSYPEYGTEFLPEMVGGLRNPTSISQQYAGAMVVGQTVSQVTAGILADITEHDVSQGQILIGPLVDLAGNTRSPSREAVFTALANLSEAYPDEAREALPAAQAALDEGSVRVRRQAAQVLSNVAIEHPGAVAPLVSSLIIAVDDSDPQMRSIALVTLGTVGADTPEAIEDDIRRVIGRLDDDSSLVREHAAKAIITVAERQPDIVEPAAEASDRLRRVQRDPAVDLDEELIQQAANAIRTGTPPGQDVDGEEGTDVFTPESPDETGQSGDTRVFDPAGGDGTETPVSEPPTSGDEGDDAPS